MKQPVKRSVFQRVRGFMDAARHQPFTTRSDDRLSTASGRTVPLDSEPDERRAARFDWRNPSRSLVILAILILSVGLGFAFDGVCSLIERAAYPRTYAEYVTVYAAQYEVPENVIFALIKTESGFDSGAVSPVGAVGLMQMMPDTFRWLTDEILFDHFENGMLYDPETNIRYGTYYLSRLYARYGDWTLTLAAYNAGVGRVDGWLADPDVSDGAGGLRTIPFRETRKYVSRVEKARKKYIALYE